MTRLDSESGTDAVVVGAGLIGLACAWELAGQGAEVALVDGGAPGQATTRVSAGMLAPVAEAAYGEERLLKLTLAAAAEYPDFVRRLEETSGRRVGYMRCGAIHVALDRDEAAGLRRRLDFLGSLGLAPEWLAPGGCRAIEPALATSFHGGMRVPEEAAVDPRLLVGALQAALGIGEGPEGRRAAGGGSVRLRREPASGSRLAGEAAEGGGRSGRVRYRRAPVTELIQAGDRAEGVRLAGGEELRAGTVVVATGSSAGSLEWLPEHARPPVRPVKGQILELAPRRNIAGPGGVAADSGGVPAPEGIAAADAMPAPEAVAAGSGGMPAPNGFAEAAAVSPIAGIVATERVYLVPRADGRLFVGATVEEQGFDTAVTAGGMYELLREAYRAVPEVAELELVEATAGLRPATPDNLPVIGPGALEGLVFATGHYRNGILLAPLTARAVADLVAGGAVDQDVAVASPERFATTGAYV